MTFAVAHRGLPFRLPENTLPSILLAEKHGAGAVEFDVRATSDGHAVLLHDKTLARIWGDPRPVAEVPFDEVRALSAEQDGQNIAIPTLKEVVEATSLTLIVDCKAASIVPDIAELLTSRGDMHRARFIGEPEILSHVRKAMPEADIILSWSRSEAPQAELLDAIRPSTLNIKWEAENEAYVARIASLGYSIWTYTIDDVAEALRARSLGVEAVISNNFEAVSAALRDAEAGSK
jgi:glycerophosphoryl diester phosphodiesterase